MSCLSFIYVYRFLRKEKGVRNKCPSLFISYCLKICIVGHPMDQLEKRPTSTTALLKALAHSIRSGATVLFITGAGFARLSLYSLNLFLSLSVASGIAPYRGTKNAIWSQFVLDWGTKKKFKRSPQKWFATLSIIMFCIGFAVQVERILASNT